MEKLKLVVIAVQAGYLKKLTGQLVAMFGERVEIRAFQLGMFDKEKILPDEVVFSAIPNLDKLVRVTFPDIKGFIRARRAINPVNAGEIMDLEKGKQILVVGDHEDVTQKVIQELKQSQFNHNYIPFHPGMAMHSPVDCAVTTGEVDLVPDSIDHVINIGLRVISFETMMEINQTYGFGLGPVQINRQYILSLVHVSANWPVSRKNKYISNWIGTPKDDHPEQIFLDFIAQSPAMKDFIAQATTLSKGDHPVHIDGAIGVGKRRVAIAIHNESKGDINTFFCVNCTGEDKNLEKTLFGWEDSKGTFPGLLEKADQGTLCIEEIENMPLALQERLADFIRKDESNKNKVRVVTTGTLPLTQSFSQKKIRQSLYHQLSLHVCTMPAMADRKEDFHLLIKKFLEQDLNRPNLVIENDALAILENYTWEGNVQEFYNVIYHLACLGENKITKNMLPFYIYNAKVYEKNATRKGKPLTPKTPSLQEPLDTERIIQKIEAAGFLDEYLQVLAVYAQGKKENQSFGRAKVIERLAQQEIPMTRQKLRRKQELLNHLGLLRVMKGRAGTTISRAGEDFLTRAEQKQ